VDSACCAWRRRRPARGRHVGRSVARGDARADSDVDCYLLVTDEEYARRQAAGQLAFDDSDLCDYPDGQAGGTVIDLQYLRDVAERGPEPARFVLLNARVVFSRVEGLAELLATIPVYPEHERQEKMESFYSQLAVHLAYLKLGEYSKNPYLLAETAVQLVLFGGRLILAHNRMLYPNRKWFMRELERAPEKPAGIMELARTLLTQPSIAHAEAFYDAIVKFRDWPQPREGRGTRFRRDSEQHWRIGRPPLADL
jgi:hypothetical protein